MPFLRYPFIPPPPPVGDGAATVLWIADAAPVRASDCKPGTYSGSLLMSTPALDAVGLLFAGSPFITIYNHISEVEVALGVRPVTATRFA